jgi:hypothetical protein
MREYFRGWKRKVGVVTLMMACMSVIGWVKSHVYQDDIEVCIGTELIYSLVTHDLEVCLWRIRPLEESMSQCSFSWTSQPIDRRASPFFDEMRQQSVLGISYTRDDRSGLDRYHFLIIPYWLIAVPLTLLSAYLILWKPRKRVVLEERQSG